MTRLNTFHLPPNQWPEVGGSTLLKGTEARHMTTVLRTREGESVRLIDGHGRSGIFKLEKGSKNEAVLRAHSITEHTAPASGVVLALGWNKSKRRDWIFEKAVELGALGIIFWRAERSQGKPPSLPKENWQDKLLQAAKQCGAVHIPQIHVVDDLQRLVEKETDYARHLIAWEKMEDSNSDALLGPEHFMGKTLIVIGPEGGFDDTEIKYLISSNFLPVSLGGSILRWETAALHALSLAYHEREKRS